MARHSVSYKSKPLKPGSRAAIIGGVFGPVCCVVLQVVTESDVPHVKVKITGKGFPGYNCGDITCLGTHCVVRRSVAYNAS